MQLSARWSGTRRRVPAERLEVAQEVVQGRALDERSSLRSSSSLFSNGCVPKGAGRVNSSIVAKNNCHRLSDEFLLVGDNWRCYLSTQRTLTSFIRQRPPLDPHFPAVTFPR